MESFDDIEWEDDEGNVTNDSITISSNNDTSFQNFRFDENSLEFEDDEEQGNKEENETSFLNNKKDEDEKETDDENAIEFEIDTNIYKKGKQKKIIKRVDVKEKRSFLHLHKATLVLYLASFKYTATTLSNENLNSILLSIIPQSLIKKYKNSFSVDKANITTETTKNSKKSTRSKITNDSHDLKTPQKECFNEIISWYTGTFKFDESIPNVMEEKEGDVKSSKRKVNTKDSKPLPKNLLYNQILKQINQRKLSKKLYVELFYMVCNLLEYECRLVRSLNTPPPVPVTPSKMKRIQSANLSPAASKKSKSLPNLSIRLDEEKEKMKVKKTTTTTTTTAISPIKKKINEAKNKGRNTGKAKKKEYNESESDSDEEENERFEKEDDSNKMITTPVTKRQMALQRNNSPEKKRPNSKKRVKSDTDTEESENEDEDKKKFKRSSSEPISKSKNSKKDTILSKSSSTLSNTNNNFEIENWLEIFDHDENRWITIDIINKTIDKADEFEKYEAPFSYVIGYNTSLMKDITSRYTNNYIGASLKRLPTAQTNYWVQLIENIFNDNSSENNEDSDSSAIKNKHISPEKRKLLEEIIKYERKEKIIKESKLEFPQSFAQFKTHPVFILEKDIPKYSSPDPNEKPLGLFKDEHKIYHRDQIKALHTSDKWVQYGYMVRDGEQPVKVVKGRSKSNPTSLLYGEWQVNVYKPPVIVDGIVPTNSFGNVYLFKPEMLPIGGVHLKGVGYARVARKLKISIAPAVVGWDVTSRRSYPLLDGIIVAKENSKKLYKAWLAESAVRAEANQIKKQEEIKARWKRFMKGLLIKEYIQKTYSADGNEKYIK
ncbi:hypothetical protein DICPUDRAFT_94215 [Dictyostelium purpureum]|uniref:Rad4 beta-hairpin domain-containing protein n=1 Tax=Dictyostelium purpureum TaxID=5786 RepID=F0ZGS9_DICPU|nr:uncharacterized protein DICPUDRAFT_94215 [Dictyostelium purpureum]EGC36824.1 hypothetical protein DICPUDRAFT_94215 [Dictyostelium purpureum]|eukprot:XP_003286622.1 hypothetical protein DICPUDRAFT_94215 [Dictyostelium purpureum]